MLNGRQFCGGSLIDAQHVLTAAHCVYFMNRGDVSRLRVQIGDHNIYSTSDGQHQVRGASNVYFHRGFSMRTLYDDVAVIRLGSPVSYNRFVQPICLSTNSWGLENFVANVAGWGQLSNSGSQSSVLRTVGVRIWKQPDCMRTYQGRAPAGITNGMVCAGGSGYDSCKGDSGGPLSVTRNSRAEQIGIVSWGVGCGSFPGVYTGYVGGEAVKTKVDVLKNYTNMRFLIIFAIFSIAVAFGSELDIIDFSSDDTVVVEALDDETEASATTTLPVEERVEDSLDGSKSRQELPNNYCVTNTGLSGTCEPVQECFPRLFPVKSSDDSESDDDTPGQTGVYNQVLAKLLIEASGFCGSSRDAPTVPLAVRNTGRVCCATSKVNETFPLEDPSSSNDTSAIEADYLKKPCGYIKVDPKTLPNPEKVVGGRPAGLGEFPWQVAMLRRGQQFCGASLLDSKNVLTAAHCVEFMTQNDVKALRLHMGDLVLYTNSDGQHVERKAKRVLYHKGFTMKNLDHDPVCLHPGNPAYDTGSTEADVSGWGTTSSGGSQSSKLLAVKLRVITQSECNQKYSKVGKSVGPGMVCAGSPGKDSCQGDSGGPLVMDSRGQAKQIGIVSW
ncbi:Proclotting enzyme, partial [Orchesella cincta]